ncbi:hypothetical protein [Bacillus sp. V33-4]|uniref:hypothetical protein n=1 Tax=Bacillus sp. V33-4 TaxID=2054169 RepID=UPI000C763C00|nr:hypothetical protein [Bacillus sp. V33-4]PLR85487.1 hypothetical protein CVD23_08935 [Bacillus sp. V33-4]
MSGSRFIREKSGLFATGWVPLMSGFRFIHEKVLFIREKVPFIREIVHFIREKSGLSATGWVPLMSGFRFIRERSCLPRDWLGSIYEQFLVYPRKSMVYPRKVPFIREMTLLSKTL